MLKEIVDFSKQLEKNGVYVNIQNSQKRIDKPIVVTPTKDDLSDFDIDNIYFVFKNYQVIDNKLILKLDSNKEKEKELKISNINNINMTTLKKISDFNNEEWRNILLNCNSYIQKFPSDPKGNKSIGGNSGTNSYHILIFEANEKNLLKSKEKFKEKITNTYKKENIEKGIPEKDQNNDIINLLKSFSIDKSNNRCISDIIYDKIDALISEAKDKLKSFIVILMLPENYFNCYKEWYEEYLKRKIFKTEEKQYRSGICCACNNNVSNGLWLPEVFQNLDQAKPFIKHLGRKIDHNVAICRECSLHIFKFQNYFLNLLKISVFPLFIENNFRDETIAFIKQNNEKLNFRDIIQDIYRKTASNELDFYLIIYNRNNDFIAFDYVTGFNFYKNGISIFQIEALIANSFFTNSNNYEILSNNYFSDKVDTKEKDLDILIYKYRSQIFDYIYRAKYNSLNKTDILDMYISSLKIKLRYLYDPDTKEYLIIKRIKEFNSNFLKLDKYFGGNYMETIEEIKKIKEIKDKESFAYYAGQVVYYLLMQSEKKEKKHSMVEPFVNIATLNALGIKLIELFNAYNHAININHKKFNNIFSQILKHIYKSKEEKFDNNLKMLFYAGYFDDNIFFEKKENIEEGVSHGK